MFAFFLCHDVNIIVLLDGDYDNNWVDVDDDDVYGERENDFVVGVIIVFDYYTLFVLADYVRL